MDLVVLLPPLLALLLPGLALIFTYLHHARVRAGRVPSFRPLRGLDALKASYGALAESSKALHVATGAGRTSGVSPTAETLASLLITQRLAESVAQRGGNLAVTTGDIVAFGAARGVVRHAYRQTGFAEQYTGEGIAFVAQQTPVAYAAGVAARYHSDDYAASVVVGDYGSEALLMTGEGTARQLPQIAGATSLDALPGLVLSTNATLIGEELFAAEAYLASSPIPSARLMTQDALRRAVIVILLLGLFYQVANLVFALGLPGL